MTLSLDMMKEMVETKVSFIQRTGIKALTLEPRHIKLWAPFEGNESHIGTLYAGALFTLGEVPGGALYLTSFDVTKYYPIVKEMTIQYVRPAKTAVTIEITMEAEEVDRIQAEADADGKSEFILEGEIKDENSEVVAKTRAVYQLRAFGR